MTAHPKPSPSPATGMVYISEYRAPLLPIVSECDEEPEDDTPDECVLKSQQKGVKGHRRLELAKQRERGEMMLELVTRRTGGLLDSSAKSPPGVERSAAAVIGLKEARDRTSSSQGTRERSASDGALLRPMSELPPIRTEDVKCPLCDSFVQTGSESEVECLRLHIQTECREQGFLAPDAAVKQPGVFSARVSGLVKLLMASEPQVQLRGLKELADMAGHGDTARLEMVVEESIILPLVYCCRTGEGCVRRYAVLALARLAKLEEARTRVARCLPFATLKRVLGDFVSADNLLGLHVALAELLSNLLRTNDSIRVKLAREGAAEMLIQLTSITREASDEYSQLMRLVGQSLVFLSELAGRSDSLAARGNALVQVLQLLCSEAETLNAATVMRNTCCNDEHRHVPSFRMDCIPLVSVVLGDKAPSPRVLALETLNALTGDALRSVDAWAEQRRLVCLVVLSGTDRHNEVSRLAWPLLVLITAGAAVAVKAVEAGVVPAVLEVLVHNRARLERESLVMAVTCLTNLLSHPTLRGAVLTAAHALRPLETNPDCEVRAEVCAVLELLAAPDLELSPQAQIEADLDIMSVVGDEHHGTEELVVASDQRCLGPVGDGPWSWEIVLGELEFNMLVGAGSYAEVYKGKLRGDEVAIKRFRTKHMTPTEHLQFLNEVHVLASLSHPNILSFEAAVAKEPHYCIVTEFVSPGSLQVVLKHPEEYVLPWARRQSMAVDVANGMAYLHSFHPPIVHRDLKPSNLLVDFEGRIKVCDFGTSRQVVPSGTMSVCGTPVYMAPEVLRGERYDESADLYSFGIVLWELLTRQVPFKGVIPVVAGMKIAYEGARPPLPPADELTEPGQQKFLQLLVGCWAQESSVRHKFDQVVTILQEIGDELPNVGTLDSFHQA